MRKIILCVAAIVLLGAGIFFAMRIDREPVVLEDEPAPVPTATDAPAPAETPAPADETPEPTEAPAETPAPTPAMIDPLTGEAAADDSLVARRPYAVMVNNISVAMPAVGVSQAAMLYELMDEGGITRMEAIFTDMAAVELVGSVRSARYYNVSTARAYDAILVHAGGSDEALWEISSTGFNDICSVTGKFSGGTFFYDTDRQAYGTEHSLFAKGEGVVASADDLGYSPTHAEDYDGTFGLTFREDAADQCDADAALIRVEYAGGKTTDLAYDGDTGLYTLSQFGETYTDNGGESVRFTNVLVVEADTTLQEDGLHLTIELTGGGGGYFCCGGKYVPIRWSRADESDSFHYTLEDGTPLALGVGKTFVAVQQTGDYVGETSFYSE